MEINDSPKSRENMLFMLYLLGLQHHSMGNNWLQMLWSAAFTAILGFVNLPWKRSVSPHSFVASSLEA